MPEVTPPVLVTTDQYTWFNLQENQQQAADENARLRSTLEEWSLANRKLEVEVGRLKRTAAAATSAVAAGHQPRQSDQLQSG